MPSYQRSARSQIIEVERKSGHHQSMTRNNPRIGIMPLIPNSELAAYLRHPDAAWLVSQWGRRREEAACALHISRPRLRARHLLVPLGLPGVEARGGAASRSAMGGLLMKPDQSRCCSVSTLIERYFTERLIRQRNVSSNTIASYRDTFRLLFTFAQARLRKPPSELTLDDLDAPFVGAFLTNLETERGAGVRTRNLRLTAIRSFFRFVSFEDPAHSALIQRVLAIPSKRHDKRQVHFLTRPEIEAILAAPDRTTWLGRRDHTLLLLATSEPCRPIGRRKDRLNLG